MSRLADALRNPIPLAPNRIPRFYRGGRLLDALRGIEAPRDDDRPEDWVGSATSSWTPPGAAATRLGISSVELDGATLGLDELLRDEPEALVGADLLARAGPTLGVLVKLLDAGERLPVHCHPTRGAAASLLGSRFGKTEAWLILGVRDAATARVWAGFATDVAPEALRGWIDRQETGPMLDALVEYRVAPGDALLIPAGTPHAIGAGVFLLELQEPTDFSVVAERRGFPITDADASLGLGWDRALGFFDTRAGGDLRQASRSLGRGLTRLLGDAADPYFRALRQEVRGEARIGFEPTYAVAVVLEGRGEVSGASRAIALEPGTTFALPAAAVAGARIGSSDGMVVAWCLPPFPDALELPSSSDLTPGSR